MSKSRTIQVLIHIIWITWKFIFSQQVDLLWHSNVTIHNFWVQLAFDFPAYFAMLPIHVLHGLPKGPLFFPSKVLNFGTKVSDIFFSCHVEYVIKNINLYWDEFDPFDLFHTQHGSSATGVGCPKTWGWNLQWCNTAL